MSKDYKKLWNKNAARRDKRDYRRYRRYMRKDLRWINHEIRDMIRHCYDKRNIYIPYHIPDSLRLEVGKYLWKKYKSIGIAIGWYTDNYNDLYLKVMFTDI